MSSPSEPLADDAGQALDELERVAQERPFLAQHVAVLADILPLLFSNPSLATTAVDEESAQAKLHSGTPILQGQSIRFDAPGFARRWRAICHSIERNDETADTSQLADVLDIDGWSGEVLAREVLAGNVDQIATKAESRGLGGEQMKTVLCFALFPVLSRLREQLAAALERCHWPRGCCPFCGSWPLLAEFRGLEQIRFLRCGLCAAGWEFPRLQCPFCGTRDHHQLGYFHVDQEEEKYRVATCERCQGYVKTASTLAALTGPQLLVLDLATLHLDLAALERGYGNKR